MFSTLPIFRRTRRWSTTALATVAILGLSACGEPNSSLVDELPPANPYGHIHAITFEESTQRVLLATHHGLFDATASIPQKIGPTIDLMGFTAASDGTFYASGHPGSGTDLPDPLGLMKSIDGGETWIPLSLQGTSDFHALSVSRDRIIGYDGNLRSTADGQKWSDVGPLAPTPYALVGSSKNSVVLATTEEGVWRSVDSGKTWAPPEQGPRLLTATFADPMTIVGVTPEGNVHLSLDTGLSWKDIGTKVDPASALGATRRTDGILSLWMATDRGLVEFSYDGTTFTEEAR